MTIFSSATPAGRFLHQPLYFSLKKGSPFQLRSLPTAPDEETLQFNLNLQLTAYIDECVFHQHIQWSINRAQKTERGYAERGGHEDETPTLRYVWKERKSCWL